MAIIKDKIINLLNYRIEQEEYSSRLYKAMSVWLDINGYTGGAKLWGDYSKEELTHADWTYQYLLSLNILPVVPAIKQPELSFKGLQNIIALSYKHELDVLKQCQELADTCQQEGDYMTLELAQRFLKEQVDEIEKTSTLVDKLEAFGESKESLRLLDNELGGL